jgi:hypothetical protein
VAPVAPAVLLHVPTDQADYLEDDVAEAARAHGIGVITAADPEDYGTWNARTRRDRPASPVQSRDIRHRRTLTAQATRTNEQPGLPADLRTPSSR